MSLEELKQSVIDLTPDERFRLAAFLRHLAEQDDPDYQKALDEADARISSGQRVTLDLLKRDARSPFRKSTA
ncbi:MAG: hypothetical protein HY674_13190 [Chloroflexi bacterium]|nr:hypothetical protein [Chloroflexota bacterium]